MMTDINRYLDFVLKLFFAFRLAFEIPIATIILVWSGDHHGIHQKQKALCNCRLLYLWHAFDSPDVISQALLAIPMWFLFEIGIFFAGFSSSTI